MKPLYALVVQHKQLENLDIEAVDEETILNTLELLEGEIALKAESIAAMVRNTESFAEAIETAAKKMQARAKKLQVKSDRMKAYLLQQMLALGKDKVETVGFTIKVKKNPPAVIIDDYDLIPEKYWHDPPPQNRVVSRGQIKTDIEHGDEVPGARLDSAKRLEIKE
jgi:hypothetical protein